MTEENNSLRDAQSYPEGRTEGDPSVAEAGVDEVMLRVEGQNENITTPSQEIQGEVARTADDVKDLTLGIEDASG